MSTLPPPVHAAITALLTAYIKQPVQAMREIGLQAKLRDHIASLLQPGHCGVQVVDVGSQSVGRSPVPGWKVDRVQLEAKVWQAASPASDRSDLVVFLPGPAVTLTRYPNGILDIVSRVHADEVEAVVELKAACTFDKGQRHLFRKDIRKLWDLAPAVAFDRHFVLIDKSLPVPFAPPLPARKRAPQVAPVCVWHTENQAQILKDWSPKALDECWWNSPRPILHHAPPVAGRFVHVWDLANSGGELVVRHRYATFPASGSAPQHSAAAGVQRD